jgi:hypothetical protein
MDTKEVMEETRKPSVSSLRVEDVGPEKVRIEHSHMVMPDALVGLSDAELKSLGRKATFKLDAFVMPSITIMYILNYLDRQVCLLWYHDINDLANLPEEHCICKAS